MTGRRTRDEIDSRLADVRRSLRDRRAGIEPDAHFVDRVIARLPRDAQSAIRLPTYGMHSRPRRRNITRR